MSNRIVPGSQRQRVAFDSPDAIRDGDDDTNGPPAGAAPPEVAVPSSQRLVSLSVAMRMVCCVLALASCWVPWQSRTAAGVTVTSRIDGIEQHLKSGEVVEYTWLQQAAVCHYALRSSGDTEQCETYIGARFWLHHFRGLQITCVAMDTLAMLVLCWWWYNAFEVPWPAVMSRLAAAGGAVLVVRVFLLAVTWSAVAKYATDTGVGNTGAVAQYMLVVGLAANVAAVAVDAMLVGRALSDFDGTEEEL